MLVGGAVGVLHVVLEGSEGASVRHAEERLGVCVDGAIVDNGLLLVSDKMMPSVGLFEDESYRLIPYQVDVDLGYHKGFNLNGIVDTDKINLKVVVMWKDYFEIKTEREYFSFDLSVKE